MSKTAIVFPGQGAQFVGMGKELYESSTEARRIFDRAEGLRKGTIEQCFSAPIDILSKTINTQPCMFVLSLASARAMQSEGLKVDAVAGFSVGELAALTFAEAFAFDDGFKTVCKRAELMHRAAENAAAEGKAGAMAAVLRLPAEKVEELCEAAGVFAVNYNCPGQTVVAGESAKITEFISLVASSGGRALPLAVSGAFHSPQMEGASKEFADYLKTVKFNTPKMPVYANVTAQPYTDDEEQNKRLLAVQVCSPVRWQTTIESMAAAGITDFAEAQPGKVLTGLISKILTK